MVGIRRVDYWRKSGGVEPGHALIADVSAEKASLRFCTEEGLVIGSRELEVSIDMSGIAETQIEYLPRIVIGRRGEHLGVQRSPFHIAVPSSREDGFVVGPGSCDDL